MLSLLEIAERAQRGPKVGEKDWNMGLFAKMNELTTKYEIAYPGDGSFLNMDGALADRAFQAGIEFLTTVGMYCLSTGRVIRFTEREVKEGINAIPAQITVGEGKDARVIKKRNIEEKEGFNQTTGHHAPWSEEMAPLVVKNFAEIPTCDYLEGFNFAVVDGREIHGLPLEVYAAKREAVWLREGVRKAGRPGLAVAYYPINTRAPALLAPIDREHGLRPTDGILLSTLPDIKVELDYIAAAIVYDEYGAFKVNGGATGSVGGFAGGLGGAVLESLVKSIGGFLVYRDEITTAGVGGVGVTTAKKMSVNPQFAWANSVLSQALCAHTNLIRFGSQGGASGPGTESHLWEIAVGAILMQINGANLYVVRQREAQMDASQTPLEAEWFHEVASAAIKARLDRGKATEILHKIAPELEGRAPEAPPGPAWEYYDFVHHRPRPQYEAIYLKVKEGLARLGLDFG